LLPYLLRATGTMFIGGHKLFIIALITASRELSAGLALAKNTRSSSQNTAPLKNVTSL
jgi:hypothetical protein